MQPTVQRATRAAGALAAALLGAAALCPASAHAAVPADNGAKVIAEQKVRDRVWDLTISSPSLTFTKPKARVFTPAGYSKRSKKRWPVLYVYGGGTGGDYRGWDAMTDIKDYAARYDALVVLPEGGVGGGFTNWYNGGAGGGPNWETFLVGEVPQLLERNYRASASRAVMGISSGGQGAITFAGRHPGFFRYAASFSGILHLTQPGISTVLTFTDLANGVPGGVEKKWGDPVADRTNWMWHDPYVLAQNLRGTGLYVSAGTTGRPGPLDAKWEELLEEQGGLGEALEWRIVGGYSEAVVGSTVRSMVRRLDALGIPVTAHVYGDGLHNWAYWNREFHLAWPLIMKAIGAKRY
ncbi:alpha/beta hydrolase family protein [Actinocorallia longicatena]|uniref:Alpha/beta hydrolase family protein n=1 Tax=Actinocorallia longicatena TaxID=111803 RepID=A0ABP6QQT9_9ACTN